MNWNSKPRIFALLILAVAAPALFLAGCKDFSFFSELGIKGGLHISPSEVTVAVDESVTFTASGGNPPYTYDVVSGTGSIVAGTGVYTAPTTTGSAIVVATDSSGQAGTASVTVVSTFEALKISPTTASVSVGNSISFVATGGVGSYTFAFQTNNSGGSITPGGVYTSGSTTGVSDTIIVTDSDTPAQTCSVPAVVSVTAAVTNVDYRIPVDTFPASALVATSIGGDFTIQNDGSATGTASISWWLFISEDGTFGGEGEHLVDSGIVTDDIPTSGNSVVAPTGNWPSDLPQGNYDLFVMVSSPEDLNHGNNVYDAGTFTLNVPDVDYRVPSAANLGETHVGGPISGQFMLDNAGTDDGTQTVTWKAYLSANTTVDVGDTLIDSNTEGAMTSAEAPRTVSFGGTWPSSPGSYYLVVEVIAGEDTAAGNDGDNTTATGSALSVEYPDVDYEVLTVNHTLGTHAGGSVDGNFDLDNIGVDDGTSSVDWEVYASNNTTIDVGDALIASGTASAMNDDDPTANISFSGTWPTDPGSYYLVVEVSAFDDNQAGNFLNNVTATGSTTTVSVADVDYYADAISSAGGAAGGTLSCSFDLNNAGGDAGGAAVTWKLYVSANAALDAGDYFAASNTAGPLGAAPASTTVNPSGATWPVTPGDYYLIVEIESVEDVAAGNDGNDVAVSGGTFTVAAPNVDYIVDQVNFDSGGSTYLPDGTVKGNFVYKNNGPSNGSQPVSWEAYASLDYDIYGPTLDAGDVLIESGSGLPPLGVGAASGSIPFSGKWPLDYGKYFLLVRVMSSDETNPGDNVGASGATESVGYFDESLNEPNDDYLTLTDFYDPGVTFKPGMSIEITGSMSSTDMDDIIAFNTGTCSLITFSITYTSAKAQLRIFLMDGPNNFIDGVSGTPGAISLNWTADAPGAPRYLNIDNRGDNPPYSSTYTCVITGN